MMTNQKRSKQVHAANYYHDPNHDYFSSRFEELVQNHGGKWIVLAKGQLIAICEGSELDHWLAEAEKKFPQTVPFATPIPREDDIECLL
jgi:hypothetical protein